jgi:hypothetical protein
MDIYFLEERIPNIHGEELWIPGELIGVFLSPF